MNAEVDDTEIMDMLINGFETAMLVTRSPEGYLRARPMVIARHEERGVLMFLTRAGGGKLAEILGDSHVVVTMQDDNRYLSLSGTVHVDTDLNRIDTAWSAVQRLWFPEGTDDPDLVLLVVEPARAEFWDRSGLNAIAFAWEAGKALLRGEVATSAERPGHGTVELERRV